MTHSLVWKEWRENRAILLAGLASSAGVALLIMAFALASDDRYVLNAVTDVLRRLCLTLLWPLFIVLLGAATFSAEKTGRTMDFLISRPVSRARVWGTKVGLAAGCAVALVLSAVLLLWALEAFDGPNFVSDLLASWPLAPAVGLALFASAVLLSGRASQALAAAAMAAVLALITVAIAPVIASSLGWWARKIFIVVSDTNASAWRSYSTPDVALAVASVAAVYLLISLWRFAGDELREGTGVRSATLVAAAILAAAFLCGRGSFALAQWTLSPEWGRVVSAHVSPDGTTILFDGRSVEREQSQIWMAPVTGGQMERFAGRRRATFGPVFSRDGAQVAYFSSADGPGSIRGVDLFVARGDGSGARLVAEELLRFASRWTPPPAQFSHDGTRIAVLQGAELSVVSTSDGHVVRADPADIMGINRRATLVGWTPDDAEILVRTRTAMRYPFLYRFRAFDVATGTVRTLQVHEDLGGVEAIDWLAGEGPSRVEYLAVYRDYQGRAQTVGVRAIELLDHRTGSAHVVTEEACYGSAVSAGPVLYYFSCHAGENGRVVSRLHRVDGATLEDVELATVAGDARGVVLDPRRGRLAVSVGGSGIQRGTRIVIVDLPGNVRETTFGWSREIPLGWTDDGRVILGKGRWAASPMMILDPESSVWLPLTFD